MASQPNTTRARLAHAWTHIDLFDTRIKAYLKETHSLVTEKEPEGNLTRHTIKGRVTEPIPENFRFIFGDAVHNLAATCDNLLASLRDTKGFKGNCNFPVNQIPRGHTSGKDFHKWRTDNKRLGKEILDIIQDAQPFNSYTADGGERSGVNHPLAVLYKLWNNDKHDCPLEATCINRDSWLNAMEINGSLSLYPGQKFEDGAILATIVGEGPQRYEINALVGVCLQKRGLLPEGQFANDSLIEIHKFVRDELVNKLEPFL